MNGAREIFMYFPTKCGALKGTPEASKSEGRVTLQGTNISPQNGILKMIFLFPRWDMLIPWRVALQILDTEHQLCLDLIRHLCWLPWGTLQKRSILVEKRVRKAMERSPAPKGKS